MRVRHIETGNSPVGSYGMMNTLYEEKYFNLCLGEREAWALGDQLEEGAMSGEAVLTNHI